MLNQPDDIAAIVKGLTEARRRAETISDLTVNWDLFSDAEPLPCDRDEFLSRMLDGGFVELVEVDDDALDDPFAWERGIEPGGMMWRLTETGLRVRAALQEDRPC